MCRGKSVIRLVHTSQQWWVTRVPLNSVTAKQLTFGGKHNVCFCPLNVCLVLKTETENCGKIKSLSEVTKQISWRSGSCWEQKELNLWRTSARGKSSNLWIVFLICSTKIVVWGKRAKAPLFSASAPFWLQKRSFTPLLNSSIAFNVPVYVEPICVTSSCHSKPGLPFIYETQ